MPTVPREWGWEKGIAPLAMNVVATGSGRFVEVQGTGEECTFTREELDGLTDAALGGIVELTKLQEQAIAEGERQ